MMNVNTILVATLLVILYLFFDVKRSVERYKRYVDALEDFVFKSLKDNDDMNVCTQNMLRELISAVYDKKEEKKND